MDYIFLRITSIDSVLYLTNDKHDAKTVSDGHKVD